MRKDDADAIRANERARQDARRAARDAAVAREQATRDEGAAEDARKLLVDWTDVRVARHGAFWVVAGRSMSGCPWSTTDKDPVAAASRLLANDAAEAAHKEARAAALDRLDEQLDAASAPIPRDEGRFPSRFPTSEEEERDE
jgi:hypothetical protein